MILKAFTTVYDKPVELENVKIFIVKYVTDENGRCRKVAEDRIEANGLLLKEYIDDIGTDNDTLYSDYSQSLIRYHVILIKSVLDSKHEFLVGKNIVAEVEKKNNWYSICLTDSQTEAVNQNVFWGKFVDEMVEESLLKKWSMI